MKNQFFSMHSVVILTAAFILNICLLVAYPVQEKIIEDQLRGLDTTILETETHYGMHAFKEEHFGVTVEKLRAKYGALIRSGTTLEESMGLSPKLERSHLSDELYQQLLVQFAAEWRDGHFNILRSTTPNNWSVGIYALPIEGQLTVTGFNDKIFTKELSKLEPKVGDIIVEVNGESVDKIARRFEPSISLATYDSRMTLAYKLILNRSNRWIPSVKTGDEVRVKFRRPNPKFKEANPKKDGDAQSEVKPEVKEDKNAKPEPEFIEFEALYHWINSNDYWKARSWFPYEEPVKDEEDFILGYSYLKTYFSEGIGALKDQVHVSRFDEEFNRKIRQAKGSKKNKDGEDSEKEKKHSIDLFQKPESETQALAKLSEVTNVPVYIIRYKGKQIGVIRIPDYGIFIDEIRWLGEIVGELNKATDVLIVDQLDNGGGYVWSGAQVARLFANEEDFSSISMNLKLSKTLLYYMDFWETDEKNADHPPLPLVENEIMPKAAPKNPNEDLMPTPNFTKIYLARKKMDELRKKYESGERYSGFLPYFGVQNRFIEGGFGRIAARDGKTYNKPVLILNDQYSASCGDFFPSMMQANGRALIYGGTSMGLGAPVYRSTALPYSEMFMRCPFGDCLKPDGLPIENIGAVPDLPRWITPADLEDSFKDWSKGALDIALQLADGKSSDEVKVSYFAELEKDSPKSDAFKAAKALFDALQVKISENLNSDQIIAAYEEFFGNLLKNDAIKLKPDEWAYLSLHLPKTLLLKDMILMSLRTPDEIVDRLKQMRELPRFVASSEDLKLINYLAEKLPAIGHSRRVVCYDLMKGLAQYKKPVKGL